MIDTLLKKLSNEHPLTVWIIDKGQWMKIDPCDESICAIRLALSGMEIDKCEHTLNFLIIVMFIDFEV